MHQTSQPERRHNRPMLALVKLCNPALKVRNTSSYRFLELCTMVKNLKNTLYNIVFICRAFLDAIRRYL